MGSLDFVIPWRGRRAVPLGVTQARVLIGNDTSSSLEVLSTVICRACDLRISGAVAKKFPTLPSTLWRRASVAGVCALVAGKWEHSGSMRLLSKEGIVTFSADMAW